MKPARCAPVISIASGKGGVGKTNVAVNLAVHLGGLGVETLLVDGDLGTANADLVAGAPIQGRPTAASFSDPAATVSRFAVTAPGGYRLLPGSVGGGELAMVDHERRRVLLDEVTSAVGGGGAVLLDTGAGIGPAVTGFIDASDAALLVTTPEPTAITDVYALLKCLATRPTDTLSDSGADRLGLVVNLVTSEREARDVHDRLSRACARFLGRELALFGWVRRDSRLEAAVRAAQPVALASPRSLAARDLGVLARRLRTQLVGSFASSRPVIAQVGATA
ncbi:MAG: P-loop NTPase [Planctomycetota bacterium]